MNQHVSPAHLTPPIVVKPRPSCSVVSFRAVDSSSSLRLCLCPSRLVFLFVPERTDVETCGGAEVHAGIVLLFGGGV